LKRIFQVLFLFFIGLTILYCDNKNIENNCDYNINESISNKADKKYIFSKSEAEKIAIMEFSTLGYGPIERYEIFSYDEGNKWRFWFESFYPGYHCTIEVDKYTGEIKVYRGE